MESLQLKKAIFNVTEIVIFKKNDNITIKLEDIEFINYDKPTFFSCLFAGLVPDGTFPGCLRIFLNKKIKKSKTYLIRIKYIEFLQLPEVYRKIIDPTYGLLWKTSLKIIFYLNKLN